MSGTRHQRAGIKGLPKDQQISKESAADNGREVMRDLVSCYQKVQNTRDKVSS